MILDHLTSHVINILFNILFVPKNVIGFFNIRSIVSDKKRYM